MQPALEELPGELAETRCRAPELDHQRVEVRSDPLGEALVAGDFAPASDVLGANLGMELKSVGGSAEPERLIRARDRARQWHRAPRETETILVPAEDLEAARQPCEEWVVVGGVRQEDVVQARLWTPARDDRAEGAR